MKLKYIELYGFKSFADKTKLLFNKDISAIVGPNGSGKSNISDAIRWVLGEQSAKSLRGSNMQDVIFSGTEDKKQMNMAQVSIVLDNSDKSLPIAFNEVNVTRRVFRTGESEYLINKSPVRLKDVKELFLDTGIGKDGYSIIGQGRIDEILNGRPEDRREIFDEAGGISKNKYKKTEAERKLVKNEENIERLNSEIKVKQQESDLLEVQSNNAKEGIKLTSKLEILELNLLDKSIRKASEDLINDKSRLEYIDSMLSEESEKLSKLQNLINPVQIEISEMENKIENLRNTRIEQEKRLQILESDINLLNEKSRFYNTDIERISNDIIIKNKKQNQYSDDLINKKEKLENLEKNKELLIVKQKELDNKISELKKEISEKREKYSNLFENLENDKKILSNLQVDKNTKDQLDITNEKLKKSYLDEINLLEIKIKEIKEKNTDFENENIETNNKISFNTNKIEEVLSNRENILNNINNIEIKQQKSKDNLLMLKSQRDILYRQYKSYDGYYKSVQNLLQNANRDNTVKEKIIGVLADLISIDDKYKTALDVALGSSLQNIVIENENDGKFLIEYIKRNRIGRITFLPINKVNGYKTNVSHPKMIDTLNNLVKFDKRIEKIIDYFLARTILVENMDDAIKVSNETNGFRVITLEGEVINSWGSMVGGSIFKKEQNSLINRKKELEDINKKISDFESTVQKFDASINKEKEVLNDIIYKLQKLDDDNKDLLNIKDNIRYQINELNIEKTFNEKRLSEYKSLLKNVEEELVVKDYSNIDDLVQSIKNDELEYENLGTTIEEKNKELTEYDKKLYSINSEIDIFERDKNLLLNDIENIKFDIQDINNNLENDKKSLDLIESELKNGEEKSSKLISEKENIESSIESTDEIEKYKMELSNKKANISKDFETIENLKNSISENEKEKFKLEIKIDNAEQKVNDLRNDYIETYSISNEDLDIKLENIEKVDATRKEVLQIKNRLSEIGYFNFESIERFNIVSEELQFMKNQYNDLVESREDIVNMISNIEKEMKLTFKEAFQKIQIRFNEIFKILFNGGEAELKLESGDILSAGIDIIARPPGKKLKSIALLSGGEKAMTAVALLFAIFETNPAPFCILDEIDAALDEANTKRYVNYLKSLTDKTQFIMITHRKASMEMADVLYGVTMEERGISKVITLLLEEYN